jgi:hypothetical protein
MERGPLMPPVVEFNLGNSHRLGSTLLKDALSRMNEPQTF